MTQNAPKYLTAKFGFIAISLYRLQMYPNYICKMSRDCLRITIGMIAIIVKQVQFSTIHNKMPPFLKNLISFVF